MKKLMFALMTAAVFCGAPSVVSAAAKDSNKSEAQQKKDSAQLKQENDDFDHWYLEAAVGMLMPGCGNELKRGFNMVGRGGYNFNEHFGLEVEGQIAPNMTMRHQGGGQKIRGFGAQGLWHPFGYERFDPFLSFGAGTYFGSNHVFGGDDRSWGGGPRVGLGAMYHMTDHWALRGDARATMLIDDPVGMMFDWDVGVVYSFGGSGSGDKTGAGAGVVAMADPNADADGDGLIDTDEAKYGTDPHDPDTDKDGLKDGEEVHTYHTDPLNPDTDSDQLKDGEEVHTYHTDPLKRDTDNGGVADGHEVQIDHTDPLNGADDLCLFSLEMNFEYDKSDVNPEYQGKLTKIAKLLLANPQATALIEGHADRKTGSSPAYNQKLSERRAVAAKDVLAQKGVAANRMTTKGYGFSRPKVTPNLTTGNPENRRVEIYIRGVSGAEGDAGAQPAKK